MANLYVRSTDGSDADNGSTWALAKATIGGAAAIDTTTDRTIMVSDNHAETPSGATSYSWAGTQASPTIIRCVDDSAEPPTATAATATVVCDNRLTLCNSGNVVWYEGISFTAGNGGSLTYHIDLFSAITSPYLKLSNCDLILASTGIGSNIRFGEAVKGCLELYNVDVKFAASAQYISVTSATVIQWNGGALLSGGTSPTTLFNTLGGGVVMNITGLDLTNAGTGINLFNSTEQGVQVVCRNFKMPTSWSGAFHSGTPGRGSRFSFYNCDASDTNYRLSIHTAFGTIINENTIVRTGGANDGTTGISWKMVSGADAEWPLLRLDSDEIVVWNDTTGSSKTVTVETVTDNVTLQDDDIELLVIYYGTSGRPLGTYTSSGNTNTLSSGTNLTTSSETWTTTGLTTPVKQKMSVSFTPQENGFVIAKVNLHKASTTVYVDPKLTIT